MKTVKKKFNKEIRTEVVSIKVTPTMKARMKTAAEAEKRSIANFIEVALEKYMGTGVSK